MPVVVPLKKALLFSGHVCARFRRWQGSVSCILAAGSLESLDDRSRGRLLYALMMCGPGSFSLSTLDRLIRSESNKSPEMDCWLAAAAQKLGRLPEAIRLYRQSATSHELYGGASAVSQMAMLLEEISSGEAASRIGEQVDALYFVEDQELILVTLGHHHLPLFDEWLKQTRSYASGRVVAAGLDAVAVTELRSRLPGGVIDLSRYFSSDRSGKLHAYSKHALWIVRTLLIRDLVCRDHPVLSIDLDAFLMGNLDRMLDGFPSADIIIQQDFSIPMDVARSLGFVLCCGFMHLRPTVATKAFLDRFVSRAVVEMDDQLAINHMIHRAGISHISKTQDALSFESLGVRWLCPARSVVSRDFNFGTVVRHFQQNGETIPELRAKLGLSSPIAP
jgi:hypothetical protein